VTSNANQLLESVLTEARDAISQLSPSPSFDYVASAAAAYRRIADRLARAIEASTEMPPIVCRRGCAQCCHVPSMLRPENPLGRTGDIYGMSIFDLVTLVEGFPEIERLLGATVGDKMIATARAAMGTTDPQPCPFLTDADACGIYPLRPSACQLWYSADLATCTYNRFNFYLRHEVHTSNASKLRAAIEQPFKLALSRQFPDLVFSCYDYLASFKMLAEHRRRDNFATIRAAFAHRPDQFFAPLVTPLPD
jgi:Fe-S-cluster containining protein